MRMIDADALIEKLDAEPESGYYSPHDVISLLTTQPVVEERKTGKWIHDGYNFSHGNDWIHCSECGKRGINVPADLTNFCPNCGADMRGDET